MNQPDEKRYSPPAVEQAGKILFLLAENRAPQMSLTNIAKQSGISGSKAYGILTALEKFQLIVKLKDKKGYALGAGLLTLSRKVLDDQNLSSIAEPVLEALTHRTGYTSVFGLISGDSVYIASKKEGTGDIRIVTQVGLIMPLTYGAHGKAIIPFFPESKRKHILAQEHLMFHCQPEKLDRQLLHEELSMSRTQGFASAKAESAPGITVVCAPVMGLSGGPFGFIEIFVPIPEKEARNSGPIVAAAARDLSQRLGAQVNL